MRQLIIFILLILPSYLFATPQVGETLIYNGDTLVINDFPLEKYRAENVVLDSKLSDKFPWQTTVCYRGYHGTWKVINDSLYLIKLENDTDGYNEVREFDLSIFFNKDQLSDKGVFAFWYSSSINTHYGEFLDYNDNECEESPDYSIYSGSFLCMVKNGVISDVKISMKSQSEIDSVLKNKLAKEDTTAFIIVDEKPKLILDSRIYKDEKDFIQKNLRFPDTEIDCQGNVYVSFIVEKNGVVSNVSLLSKLCPEFDEEALKVINLMRKWEPGKLKGKVVRVKMMYPVRFK